MFPSAENPAARLIVCERTGCWAAALRRELGVRVWETRTLADCRDELERSPASFVVVELGSNAGGVLRLLTQQPRRFPAARLAVAADRCQADCEWLMREAGAVHFLCSPRQIGLLARLASRHLAGAPTAPQSLADRIWMSLPWG